MIVDLEGLSWVYNKKSKYKSEIEYLGKHNSIVHNVKLLKLNHYNTKDGIMKHKLTDVSIEHVKMVLRERNLEELLK